MRNPNPKQLDEECIQYWLKSPKAIYDTIQDVKEKLKAFKCKLAHNIRVIKSNKNVIEVVNLIEQTEQIKEKIAEKEESLAQWRYIKWRYEQTIPETVVFT